MAENELIISLPLDRNIINPITGLERLVEQPVSHQGRWRIHKGDPDNIFPSDPHEDKIDEPEKLDLYTGEIYDRNKMIVRTLSKKSMQFIYNKIIKNGEENIKQKLIANVVQVTYLKEWVFSNISKRASTNKIFNNLLNNFSATLKRYKCFFPLCRIPKKKYYLISFLW